MVGVTALVDDRVKTVFLVCHVLDGPQCAVGIMHAVRPLHHVAISVLVRGLVVAGVGVLHSILIRVFWMSLRETYTHTHTLALVDIFHAMIL